MTHKEDIEHAFFEFYQQQFSRRKVDLEGFKKEVVSALPKLDDETKHRLEQEVTAEEVKKSNPELESGQFPWPTWVKRGCL